MERVDRGLARSVAAALRLDYSGRKAARRKVAEARVFCERALLSAWPDRRVTRQGGRILCYHSVGQPELGVNDISPVRLAQQCERALAMGYTFVPVRDVATGRSGPKSLALTFDDAWSSVFTTARPLLRQLNIPWAVFVVSDWSDRGHLGPIPVMTWRELGELQAEGVTIGSHSRTHPDFGQLDADAIREELEISRMHIAERLGTPPDLFAVPYGLSRNWPEHASALARQAGYRFVFAQSEAKRPADTIGRSFVSCFDGERFFRALLEGAFDHWEEWV